MKNNISITLSKHSADKLMSISSIIPSGRDKIALFLYNELEKEESEKDFGGAAIKTYIDSEKLTIQLGCTDDVIDMCVDAFCTFIPAMAGAFGTFMAYIDKAKKLFKIGERKKRITVKPNDTVEIVYTVGKSKPIKKSITIGKAELGDQIDYKLIGAPLGGFVDTHVDVMGTDVRTTIYVSGIIRTEPLDKDETSQSCDDPYNGIIETGKIYVSTESKTAPDDVEDATNNNPAVRFSCEDNKN